MKLSRLYEDIDYQPIEQINLLTSSWQDVRAAFDMMEGDGFYDQSAKPDPVQGDMAESLHNAYKWLKEIHSGQYSDEEMADIMEMGSKTVYGSGGGNRYFVRADGRIDFSRMHGPDFADNAAALGFNLH